MNFFLSNRMYGTRPLTHVSAYRREPGYWTVELASWTLDISIKSRAAGKTATPNTQEELA